MSRVVTWPALMVLAFLVGSCSSESFDQTAAPPGEGSAQRITTNLTLVVIDYQQGEFEAGAYVVVERSQAP